MENKKILPIFIVRFNNKIGEKQRTEANKLISDQLEGQYNVISLMSDDCITRFEVLSVDRHYTKRIDLDEKESE